MKVLLHHHPIGGPKMMMTTRRHMGEDEGAARDLFTPMGDSPAMTRVLDLARRVAPTDSPVLITGESGTGKRMLAQFIHRQSPRHEHLLIPVNCALLPRDLVESEVFGEAAGGDSGLLERARGGTLLLDDVDHLPPLVQVRLLRVIERRIVPQAGGAPGVGGAGVIGGERAGADGPTDVGIDTGTRSTHRFMATLNGPADEAVREARLRMDLFYRLAIFPIHLPPLRERVADIPLLARHFLSHFWRLNRRGSPGAPTLSPSALQALQERPWPGNVRELQSVMERAAVLLDPGQSVLPEDLPGADAPEPPPTDLRTRPSWWRDPSSPSSQSSRSSTSIQSDRSSQLGRSSDAPTRHSPLDPGLPPFPALLDEPFSDAKAKMTETFELQYLTRLIRRVGGNMQAAADLGGVNKTTLYRLLQKHDLTREDILKD